MAETLHVVLNHTEYLFICWCRTFNQRKKERWH